MKQRPTAACSCQGLGHSEWRGNRKDPPAHSASLYTCVYPYLHHYCDDTSWNVGMGTVIGQIGEECQHNPLNPTRDDPPKARPEHIHATHRKPHLSARTKLYRHNKNRTKTHHRKHPTTKQNEKKEKKHHKHETKPKTNSIAQPKHTPELRELDPPQGFRENIGQVLTTWDMSDRNITTFDVIVYPMVSAMHMLHSRLMLRVFCHLDCGRVVDQDRQRMRYIVPKLAQ